MNKKLFISKCTLTFKAFDFDVTLSESKSTLWNFVTFNPNNQKSYAVYCTKSATESLDSIKNTLTKLPAHHRLVVVAESHTDEEVDEAHDLDYCLVSLEKLELYGQEMLEIREREAKEKKESQKDILGKVIHKG